MNEMILSEDLKFQVIRPEHRDKFIDNVMTVYGDLSPSILSVNDSVPVLDRFIMQGNYYFLVFAAVNLERFKEITNGLEGKELDKAVGDNIKEFVMPVSPEVEHGYVMDTKSVLDHHHMFYALEPFPREYLFVNKPLLEVW